ncbi:hypothetical protein PLESTB_001478000 [Pleodorina starrii]|uniref:Uncharacterized protein n=1 Tax=Pleodorina starrii TaxID=330485 RepID=A0A9W6BWW4_9CHLO|nr:hypothetical protein PLESTM_000649500 [Pleodorina starrii]GLC59360.1 hypothetical protein PLESTB_001478000 [Pleodorina starrii]GLC74441.1 hypothetical protein PLESTF_001513300 [Pleodorina starrii]
MADSPKAAASAIGQRPNDRSTNHIELCRRPLRRKTVAVPGEAVGRAPRLSRGKGNPPPSDQEWQYHPSKQFVPGKSWASSLSTVINQTRDCPSGQSAPSARPRTSIRVSERAYEAHLAGGAVAVVSPPNPAKPLRRKSEMVRPRTTRVMGIQSEEQELAGLVPPLMYALVSTTSQDVSITSRPTTAPPCGVVNKRQTCAGYELARSARDDVQYRYSVSIGQSERKLATERFAAPQLTAPAKNQARNTFFDNRSDYEINRARSRLSTIM